MNSPAFRENSVTSGSMPPSQEDSFDIRHRPIGLGCPVYTSPTRAFLLPRSSTSHEQLEKIFRELQVCLQVRKLHL